MASDSSLNWRVATLDAHQDDLSRHLRGKQGRPAAQLDRRADRSHAGGLYQTNDPRIPGAGNGATAEVATSSGPMPRRRSFLGHDDQRAAFATRQPVEVKGDR